MEADGHGDVDRRAAVVSEPTMSVLLSEVQECGCSNHEGEYCWPQWFEREYRITGGLADRVRARAGVDDVDADVILLESEYDGGYSEYTRETTWTFSIQVGAFRATFQDDGWNDNGLVQLEKWLNEAPA